MKRFKNYKEFLLYYGYSIKNNVIYDSGGFPVGEKLAERLKEMFQRITNKQQQQTKAEVK